MNSGFSVCLVYPNRREVAESNLGFQKIFGELAKIPGTVCDRAYLPSAGDDPGGGITSLLFSKPLKEFDLIAFSVTFEMDSLNILKILDTSGIPLRSDERGDAIPVICAGGVAVTLNPEPLSDFFDFFVIGEGEAESGNSGESAVMRIVSSLSSSRGGDRRERLSILSEIDGIYVPSLYSVEYDDNGRITSRKALSGAPETIVRLINLDYSKSGMAQLDGFTSSIFGGSFLVETGKGCSQGCRFCAAGFIYRPVRHVSLEALLEKAGEGIRGESRIGLIGSAICEHPDIDKVYDRILSEGGKITVSSLRIGLAGRGTFERLKKGGAKSVTMAPETGSESLRRRINKPVTDKEIIDAVGMAAEAGILNVKLYFLFGLPGETEEDVAAIASLARRVRDRFVEMSKPHGRAGKISISVNPFVPKPFTPFQWEPFFDASALKKRSKLIRSEFGRESNIDISVESTRTAAAQAFLSLGDRLTGRLLMEIYGGKSWSEILKMKEAKNIYARRKDIGEILPWDFIDSGVERDYLVKEYRKSEKGETTSPCLPALSGCVRCGEFKGVCS